MFLFISEKNNRIKINIFEFIKSAFIGKSLVLIKINLKVIFDNRHRRRQKKKV